MRLLPLSGLAFVACFALAAVLYGSGAGSDPASIAAYYANHADRMRQIGGFAALAAGCVLLLAFAAVAARELVPPGALRTVAVASGAGSAVLLAAANVLWAASALTTETERVYSVDPVTHLLVEDAGFAFVVTAAAAAVPFVAAVSLAVARGGLLPRWLAALGALAVAGLVAAYWYLPLAAFLAWVAAVSVLLAGRREAPAPGF